jgi:hypothetical protein
MFAGEVARRNLKRLFDGCSKAYRLFLAFLSAAEEQNLLDDIFGASARFENLLEA